jgi:DNA-cytosine methyltransferase
MNVDTTKKFNHISLCTGYGGIDLGLARVIKGLRAIAYCEIELYAIENLIDKMEKGIIPPAPIWSNLKTFPFKEFRGCVDILSGGFPCQPFSNAGRRNGDTDPRHLFPFIKQGIIDSRPAFVLLENVRGIISSKLQSDEWNDPKDTSVLLHVIRELERIGYECHWGIFSARETGLPHLRQRVFILGKRTDITNSRLKEFSEYFQDSAKEFTPNNSNSNTIVHRQYTGTVHDKTRDWTSDTTVLLQAITESTFNTERIESSSICKPSGRDREQQFFEPPRTLRKDLGNSRKDGSQAHELLTRGVDESLRQGASRLNRNASTEIKQAHIHGTTDNERTSTSQAGIRENTGGNQPLDLSGNVESEMGGNANGVANWLDYEKLCNSYTSIVDEIALLGNGVVPATAEIAFRILFNKFL